MGIAKSLYVSRNGRRIRRAVWDLVSTLPPPLYVSIPHIQAARSRNPYGLLAQVTLHKSCSHWSSVLKSSWPRRAAAASWYRGRADTPRTVTPVWAGLSQLCRCPLPQQFLLKRKVIFHNSRSAQSISKVAVHKNYLKTYSTLLYI